MEVYTREQQEAVVTAIRQVGTLTGSLTRDTVAGRPADLVERGRPLWPGLGVGVLQSPGGYTVKICNRSGVRT